MMKFAQTKTVYTIYLALNEKFQQKKYKKSKQRASAQQHIQNDK